MRDSKPYTPFEYQHLITNHIQQVQRCAVWAGMGLGKSVSTLTALDGLYLTGETHPTLVLAPLRVARDTWPREARKWSHLKHFDVVPITGNEDERRRALRKDSMIYTTNYDNLVWLQSYLGERWPFRTVVSDESTRLKSFRLRQGGKRTQALGRVAHTKIKRFIQLTGTPSPNGLSDLWGQVWFLDAGQRLGRTFDAFRKRWFQKSFDGYSDDPLPFAQEQIQDALRDICLTIDAKDWFDLNEPIMNNISVDLPIKAMRQYKEMEQEMFTEIEEHGVEALNAAARTIKCLQIANGAAYVDESGAWKEVHDAKLQAVESILNEAAGAPVLMAYHFKSDRARLLQTFPDAIDVATKQGLADALAGKGRLWIGHPASMGHGIDGLQEHCNIAAFFGHWWNLEERLQFIERIGPVRQMQAGKDRPVFIHNIVAAGTVDELVLARHDTKREVQDLLMDAMRARKS